jgi:L-ribulose-5-phosphate 4-epimerase
MGSLKELKEQVWQSNMDLFRNNLVVHTFGNVSGIDRVRNIIAIKPSGIPYPELSVDKIVLVDLENRVVDSKYKPSSDTRSHLVLYKAFSSIGGIVHTHSPYATAWAQAGKPIPCLGTTHADHLPGEIPCTGELSDKQIKGDYETETANQIVSRFSDISPNEVQMVLVAGHGPFTWGKSPEQAVYHSLMLEEIAKIGLFTVLINPGVKNLKRSLIDKHFFRKHGKDSYYGQT